MRFSSTGATLLRGCLTSSQSSSTTPFVRSSQFASSKSQSRVESKRSFSSSQKSLADRDPYTVLGVAKDSSSSDIKKAYYQLARKFHPDTNKEKSAKEKFVEIQNAYDTLSDDTKRADFDRFGAASQQSGFDSDAYARASSSFNGAGFGDFFNGGGGGQQQGSDIFESLFGAFGGRGGQTRQAQSQVGEDIEITMNLPFIDAAKGVAKVVEISPVVDCQTCTGTGLKEGAVKSQCASCGGSGTRTFTIQSGFTMASTCTSCSGTGSTTPPGSACGPCAGAGKVRSTQNVDVEIPAGVESGMRLRVDGKGDAPLGGKGRTGNLLIKIVVQPSKHFTRTGSTLYHNATIPFYTAVLGGTARIPTLDKDVDIRVPNGTQVGEEMVLRGKGVKKLYKEVYGDLHVRFNVTIPRTLTPAQRRILNQFVSETEFPGSSSYAPSTPAPATPPPSPKAPASSRSPGLESQAKPPPPGSNDSQNFWSALKSEAPATSSTPPPSTKSTPKPKATAKSASASAKSTTPEEEKDNTLMGSFWKGLFHSSSTPKK